MCTFCAACMLTNRRRFLGLSIERGDGKNGIDPARADPDYCIPISGYKEGTRTLTMAAPKNPIAICAVIGVSVECCVFKPHKSNFGKFPVTKSIFFAPLEGEVERITNFISHVFDMPDIVFPTSPRPFQGRYMQTWQIKTHPMKDDFVQSPSKRLRVYFKLTFPICCILMALFSCCILEYGRQDYEGPC